MPNKDKTGPEGKGPKTGRGLGYCTESDEPGYKSGSGMGMGRGSRNGEGPGRGMGFGPGRGRGRR